MKTRKSLVKKIRITKNGKVIARKTGQNHYNAKGNGSVKRKKRSDRNLFATDAKNIRKTVNQ